MKSPSLHTNIFSWLRLMRVANWPSAASNILASYLVANQKWERWDQLALLLIISCCLFGGGMVLNDWNDAEYDRTNNTGRPLPRGEVTRRGALRLACGLLGAAVFLAAVLGWRLGLGEGWLGLRPLAVTSATVVFIVLYDVFLKRSLLAPVWMGLCRTGNFFLGASTAGVAGGFGGFPPAIWVLGGLLGLYVCGVTAFARRESESNSREPMFGPLMILGALVLYALIPLGMADWDPWQRRLEVLRYEWLLVFTSAIFLNRLFVSWFFPGPRQRKAAIVQALRSLVVIDSAICLLFGQGNYVPALVVLMLLPVSIALSRIHSLT